MSKYKLNKDLKKKRPVIRVATIPNMRVTANPSIGPVPNVYSTIPTMKVVKFDTPAVRVVLNTGQKFLHFRTKRSWYTPFDTSRDTSCFLKYY